MKGVKIIFLVISITMVASETYNSQGCKTSQTVASGTYAPKDRICSGALIFEDNFEKFDLEKWQHEITLGGGGNWEFQWYTNNRSNSIAENGVLKIKPTLTSDHLGEAALTSQTLDLNDGTVEQDPCTNSDFYGCLRTGTPENILNPVKSVRIRTINSFSFKYGRVEVRAKLSAGDWLWPAIWLLPTRSVYSTWPRSGEIDIMESRGNRDLKQNGVDIGVQKTSSALHWGPETIADAYFRTTYSKSNAEGFDKEFHKYEVIWTPDSLSFKVDDQEYGSVTPPSDGGFWKLGDFDPTKYENPWSSGTKLAPFDQEFYLVINLAVGGVSFFPDDGRNPGRKPWRNNFPKAATDFWNGRGQWLPSWNLGRNEDAQLQVDYVKVYAI